MRRLDSRSGHLLRGLLWYGLLCGLFSLLRCLLCGRQCAVGGRRGSIWLCHFDGIPSLAACTGTVTRDLPDGVRYSSSMSAQVGWCSCCRCCWASCDLACDDGGGAEVEEDGEGSATHQHDAASSPKGSRRPRSGLTSRDSWKRTRCVRYFILITISFDGAIRLFSLLQLQDLQADRRVMYILFFRLHITTIERDSKQAITTTLQRNTDTPDVSSKLSCHAVPLVNRTRACCHSPMHRDSVCTHGLS